MGFNIFWYINVVPVLYGNTCCVDKERRTLSTDLEGMANVLMSHTFQCESEAHFFTNFCYSSPLVEESVRALKPRVTMVRISLFLNWD